MLNIAICFLFSIIIFVIILQEILLCPFQKKKKGNETQKSELKTTASAEPIVETLFTSATRASVHYLSGSKI